MNTTSTLNLLNHDCVQQIPTLFKHTFVDICTGGQATLPWTLIDWIHHAAALLFAPILILFAADFLYAVYSHHKREYERRNYTPTTHE